MKIMTRRSCTFPKPPQGSISLVARSVYDLDAELVALALASGDAVLLADVGSKFDPDTLEPLTQNATTDAPVAFAINEET
jgi:hypothetical protein